MEGYVLCECRAYEWIEWYGESQVFKMCVSGRVKRVDLSVFESVESTHSCVIVMRRFESHDSPAYSHQIMCRVPWDMISSDALQDNNPLRVN